MAKKSLIVRKNSDGTFTIRADHYVEHIDLRAKTPDQKYESIKWAILTAGFAFSPQIERIVRHEVWR